MTAVPLTAPPVPGVVGGAAELVLAVALAATDAARTVVTAWLALLQGPLAGGVVAASARLAPVLAALGPPVAVVGAARRHGVGPAAPRPRNVRTACPSGTPWWAGEDSNLRRQCRRVYSPFPLSARAPTLEHRTIAVVVGDPPSRDRIEVVVQPPQSRRSWARTSWATSSPPQDSRWMPSACRIFHGWPSGPGLKSV